MFAKKSRKYEPLASQVWNDLQAQPKVVSILLKMQKLVVSLFLTWVFDFAFCQQCNLIVAPKKEHFFTRKLKQWFGILRKEVQESKQPDCQTCSSIRPRNQTVVPTERDSRIGCRCQISSVSDKFQCACCFKIWKWDYLICSAAGFYFKSSDVFLIVTVEDQVVFKFNISLDSQIANLTAKLLTCIPLPPPVEFLSACFRPKIERPSPANNYNWKICGKLKLGYFQVPVIKVFMKCFNIKDSHDDMIIDGQIHPHADVHDPARAEVADHSYNPIVCLSNTKKQEALNCSSSRKQRQVDACNKPIPLEVYRKINWVESKLGETPYLAVLHQRNYPIPVQQVTEDDAFPFIEAAMKRAEDEKWMNHSEQHVFKQPGRSCGGAVLTHNKVLTICACIRSFYMVNKLQKEPGEDVIFPFDIQSVDIFVDIAGIRYTAAEDYRLDKDSKKFMSNSLCAKRIASNDTWLLQTLMIVMPFTPGITTPDPGQFAQWPPPKVKSGQNVNMVAFGMELRNRSWSFKSTSGGMIEFDKTAVNFFLKQCDLTNYSKSEILKDKFVFDVFGTAAGFCSVQPGWQLCYGKIGFPLTAGGGLVGLASLPVDCAGDGSIAAAIFDPVTIHEIESYLNGTSAHLISSVVNLYFPLVALMSGY